MIRIKELLAATLVSVQLTLKAQSQKRNIEHVEKADQVLVVDFVEQEVKAHSPSDSIRPKVDHFTTQVVYNHYLQDGNNSAVTGGIGTEKLTVYGPSLRIRKDKQNRYFQLQTGVDIISSASADNIDFVVSSASRLDGRGYLYTTYGRELKDSGLTVDGGVGLSLESDYSSLKTELGVTKESADRMRKYSLQFQMFNDDLRWGLFHSEYYRPAELVYPFELRNRNREWYDTHNRNSYILKGGYTQVLNRKNMVGLFADLTLQKGLLATPFHRVYFTDGFLKVEQLPYQRWKGGMALRLHSFVGGNVILKNTMNYYLDSFEIRAISLENETSIKLSPVFILAPHFRFYVQEGTPFFKGYGAHERTDKYYTSDYDLSSFETYTLGIGLKEHFDRKSSLRTLALRYSYMYRSNGMQAHIISTSFQWDK
ncbi:MAG: DUF3570 domain-containing protein [Marinoscillum sp.]|uniref:DUF3570 domain-containing protein n=1 Tax=Marinoscillum sp. TaxID=2024838 RepID=UPI0032F53470